MFLVRGPQTPHFPSPQPFFGGRSESEKILICEIHVEGFASTFLHEAPQPLARESPIFAGLPDESASSWNFFLGARVWPTHPQAAQQTPQNKNAIFDGTPKAFSLSPPSPPGERQIMQWFNVRSGYRSVVSVALFARTRAPQFRAKATATFATQWVPNWPDKDSPQPQFHHPNQLDNQRGLMAK